MNLFVKTQNYGVKSFKVADFAIQVPRKLKPLYFNFILNNIPDFFSSPSGLLLLYLLLRFSSEFIYQAIQNQGRSRLYSEQLVSTITKYEIHLIPSTPPFSYFFFWFVIFCDILGKKKKSFQTQNFLARDSLAAGINSLLPRLPFHHGLKSWEARGCLQ